MDIRYYKHALIINTNNTNEAFIAISTFWTQKDKVWDVLDEESKSKVLIVGQLYTFNGLEWIERNTLANPNIQILIITGFDNNNIKHKLESHNLVMNDYQEYESIFWNRYNQSNGTLLFVDDYKDLNKLIHQLINPHMAFEAVVVPPPIKSEFQTYESEESGFIIRDDDLYRLWKRALMIIKLFGTMTNGTREVLNIMSVLTKEPKIDSSNINEIPAIEQIERYIPQVCDEKPTNGLSYTYGSRLHGRNQIENCIRLLSTDLLNRQACATTWEPPDDYYHPPPCLVLVVFRIHPLISYDMANDTTNNNSINSTNDGLYGFYMTTIFRSQDIYKAYFSNIYALWKLGEKVLNAVRTNTGKNIKFVSLTNNSIAAHVYENDFNKLKAVQQMSCSLDCRGYFIINTLTDEHLISVQLMNSNNEQMLEFKSNNPHELSDKCQPFISDVSHALYMGRELMRAKWCLDTGQKYVQD